MHNESFLTVRVIFISCVILLLVPFLADCGDMTFQSAGCLDLPCIETCEPARQYFFNPINMRLSEPLSFEPLLSTFLQYNASGFGAGQHYAYGPVYIPLTTNYSVGSSPMLDNVLSYLSQPVMENILMMNFVTMGGDYQNLGSRYREIVNRRLVLMLPGWPEFAF